MRAHVLTKLAEIQIYSGTKMVRENTLRVLHGCSHISNSSSSVLKAVKPRWHNMLKTFT